MVKLQDNKLTIENNIKVIELNSKLEEKKWLHKRQTWWFEIKESKLRYDK